MSDDINEILEVKGEEQTQLPAPNSEKAPEYEEPILSFLYKCAGWLTLIAAFLALFVNGLYCVTLLISSVFLFGIAQVINLIGKIEFNTRKQ